MGTERTTRGRIGPALLTLTLGAACAAHSTSSAPTPAPARSSAGRVVETLHGVEVPDPYRWLEERTAAETEDWIAAQNAHTDAVLGALPGREELTELATSLMAIETIGVPRKRGERYFYERRAANQELKVLWVREGLHGEDSVLVDPHGLSEDQSVNVSFLDYSLDGGLVAYGVRQGGVDEVEVRFLDLESGRNLLDVLPSDRFIAVVIAADGEGIYYSKYGYEDPRVVYHAFESSPESDVELFGAGYGPVDLLIPSVSDDGRWLLVHVLRGSAGPTEVHLKDLASDGPFRTVAADGESRSFCMLAGDRLVIQTDRDAPNQRVMIADLEAPATEHWKEIIPERPDVVLENVTAVGGRIVVSELRDVRQTLAIYDLHGSRLSEVEFGASGSVSDVSGSWGDSEFFLTFSSFHIPPTIYRFDVVSGERDVWARIDVPIDTEAMVVEQVHFESKDGTRVPMFVAHRKDLELDGDNPTLLTGYGGFGMSLTPGFSAEAAAWMQGGGVFAMANLRGGGEFGEQWHRAGMLENKQNVFDDFIAAAEHLVASGYTRPGRLAVLGGSNGGLLVGAILTQRPELLGAVVCTYPLLDMVRYHRFLVAAYWIPEYGSSEDPEQFRTLLAYSPYHRVEKGRFYPATLFITGDGDTRVAPLHARKMVAVLQDRNASGEPILLRHHVAAGHSGGQTVGQAIEEMVDLMSFLRWRLGVPPGAD